MSHSIFHHPNGKTEEWTNERGRLHRLDGPARQCFYLTGKIKSESYYKNGKLHRTDGPADIEYYESGQTKLEVYYRNHKLHRADGPSLIKYYESGQINLEEYHQNGMFRTNGPASRNFFKSGQLKYERYSDKNNQLHRIDGPARLKYLKSGKIRWEEHWCHDKHIKLPKLTKLTPEKIISIVQKFVKKYSVEFLDLIMRHIKNHTKLDPIIEENIRTMIMLI